MLPRRQVQVSVTLAPLGDVAAAMAWAAANGIRGVQLSATHPQTRPRELGVSARRDLRATLSRHELQASGIDLWIPPAHYGDPAHADRAVDAVRAACALASDLGRMPVSLELPPPAMAADGTPVPAESIAAIAAAADRSGVTIADASGALGCPWPPIGICMDPAAVLANGEDPVSAAAKAGRRLAAARLVDLLRSGMRGPPGGKDGARLDLLGYRVALEAAGFGGLPVIDARQWQDPHGGVLACMHAWTAVLADP